MKVRNSGMFVMKSFVAKQRVGLRCCLRHLSIPSAFSKKILNLPPMNSKTFMGGGLLSVVFLVYGYVNVSHWWDERRMAAVFENGQKTFTSHYLNVIPVEHKSVEKQLKLELIPTTETLVEYLLICGEQGAGKTTACSKIAREAKKGVVFVEFEPSVMHLGKALANAFDVSDMYDPLSLTLLPKLRDSNSKKLVNTLMPMIEKAAMEYKKRNNGVPPVLIFDNVDALMEKEGGKEIVIQLQDWAKQCVDRNLLLIAFVVSNNGPTLELMQSESSASRMKQVEVSDMEDDEAVDFVLSYLGDTRSAAINADPTAIAKLKEVVTQTIGGRALLLSSLANCLSKRDDYCTAMNDFVKSCIVKVRRDFVLSDMAYKSEEHYAAMWKVADKLLASPTFSIHEDEANVSMKDLAFLKTTSVFSVNQGCLRFSTRAHRTHAMALMKSRKVSHIVSTM